MTISALVPGESVAGPWSATTVPARKGSPGDVGYTGTVIAHWVEEHCADYTATKRLAIACTHIGAKDGLPPKVTFYAAKFDPATGVAMQPGTGVTVTNWEYDDTHDWDELLDPVDGSTTGRGAWMYFVDLEPLAADGMVEVRAICEPHDSSAGYSRGLQGLDATSDKRYYSELSLLLNSKAVSPTANRTTIYVDGTSGSDANPGTDLSPVQTITQARNLIRTAQGLSVNSLGNLGGGTILLKAGTYTPPDITGTNYNYNAFVTIKAAPGVSRDDVTIQLNNWRTRICHLRFENVRITPTPTAARLYLSEGSLFLNRAGVGAAVQTFTHRDCEITMDHVNTLSDSDFFYGDHLGLGLTGATYTASTRTVTKTGAFTAYTFVSGDTFRIWDEAAPGTIVQCKISSKTNSDTIVLDAGGGSGLDAAPLADIASLSSSANKYLSCDLHTSTSVNQRMFGCWVHHWHDVAVCIKYDILHNCRFDTVTGNGPNPQLYMGYCDVSNVHRHTAIPGIHVDTYQLAKIGSVGSEYDWNILVLNLRAWLINGQPFFHEGSTKNFAFINAIIASDDNGEWNGTLIGRNPGDNQSVYHAMTWHVTFVNYKALFWSSPNAPDTHVGKDMSTKGCLLDERFTAYYDTGNFEVILEDTTQSDPTLQPGYELASGYVASETFSWAGSLSAATKANFPGVAGRTTSRSIPFDADGAPRDATTAQGAFAFVSETGDISPGTPTWQDIADSSANTLTISNVQAGDYGRQFRRKIVGLTTQYSNVVEIKETP